LICLAVGAPELIYAIDRLDQLEADAARFSAEGMPKAVELVGAARLSLTVHVAEELALEALAFQIGAAAGGDGGEAALARRAGVGSETKH
jgi:hypothetical protein